MYVCMYIYTDIDIHTYTYGCDNASFDSTWLCTRIGSQPRAGPQVATSFLPGFRMLLIQSAGRSIRCLAGGSCFFRKRQAGAQTDFP